MIETPRLLETERILAATLHVVIPRAEIQRVMGPSLQEVFAAITAQGLQPVGPWFTHHLRRPSEVFDFDIGVPVARPIAPAGRVVPGEWPAMKVARTVYQGGYEGLGEAWSDFIDWMDANGHAPAEDLWERYLVGPESTDDPAGWRTELSRPLQ